MLNIYVYLFDSARNEFGLFGIAPGTRVSRMCRHNLIYNVMYIMFYAYVHNVAKARRVRVAPGDAVHFHANVSLMPGHITVRMNMYDMLLNVLIMRSLMAASRDGTSLEPRCVCVFVEGVKVALSVNGK